MTQKILALFVFVSMAAYGDFVPGRFQVLSTTALSEVVEGQPVLVNAELALLVRDGEGVPSRATFTENESTVEYIIGKPTEDGCGNIIFNGNPVQKFLGSIVVVDHSRSRCDVAYPAVQEVEINHFGHVRHFHGNPEIVYSLLDGQ